MRSSSLALDCGAQKRLVPINLAFTAITRDIDPVSGSERVALADAVGRVTAQDVATTIPLPPFDHSAVDGYGLNSADAAGEPPYRLRVADRLAAGSGNRPGLGRGETLQVFTGAALPTEISAVVPEERCMREGATIVIPTPIKEGANIRRRGEDVGEGSVVVESGSVLDARHLAILAATGNAPVSVKPRVRVAVLSSESDLRSPGEALVAGSIYYSNRPMLAAMLARPCIEIVDAGHFADDPEELAAAFAGLLDRADVVVSTGGAAGSETDHTQRAIVTAGGSARTFHLALRPGKPLVIGGIGAVPFLGLPGNPVAALVNFLLFGRAVILARAGTKALRPIGQAATAAMAFSHNPGRTEFVPARVAGFDSHGWPKLEKLGRGGSARLRPLVLADGLAEIPAEAGDVPAGAPITFHSFHAAFTP
jgi:molybdopterin molybdotransferase